MNDWPSDRSRDAARMSVLASLGMREIEPLPSVGMLGRVAIVHGAQAEVIWADEEGVERVETLDVPDSLAIALVAGDWVHVVAGRIAAASPRRTELRRPRRRTGEMQVLAANVDLVLIVTPVDRALNVPLLERLVVMAWDSGATPVIVLSKVDDATQAESYRDHVAGAIPNTEIVATSASNQWGVDRLRQILGVGVTAVMLGASGAGKTSLLNSLEGTEHRTRSVSRSGEGRHATTTRRLHRLSSGGVLLDIPGIRLVDLKVNRATLDGVFSDIVALAGDCRFRDCAHVGEVGCAVVGAVADGRLASRRLELWRSLMQELTDEVAAAKPRTRRRATGPDKRTWHSDEDDDA